MQENVCRERGRLRRQSFGINNGYSFVDAAETANAAYFLLFKARRAVS